VRFLYVLLVIIFPTIVSGIPFNTKLSDFNDYKEVKLILQDNVNGGCWTNLKEVREYSEEKIKNSGMTLNTSGTHFYQLVVYVSGRRFGGLCFGQINVGLYTPTKLWNGERGMVIIKEIGLTPGGNDSLNMDIFNSIGLFFKK